jgi:dsRNA-specific ribonuclease
MFDNTLSEGLLSMAVTCPSAGREFNYERLELLGTFLPLPSVPRTLAQYP